jgi:hypothetical protein
MKMTPFYNEKRPREGSRSAPPGSGRSVCIYPDRFESPTVSHEMFFRGTVCHEFVKERRATLRSGAFHRRPSFPSEYKMQNSVFNDFSPVR